MLTATDLQPDAELQQLVIIETRELLAGYGIADPEVPVVQSDDPGFVPAVAAILDGEPAGYTVAAPPPPAEGADQVVPASMLGVPYPDAIDILTADGFQPTVVVDPAAGVVSECYPTRRSASTRNWAPRSAPASASCSPYPNRTRWWSTPRAR